MFLILFNVSVVDRILFSSLSTRKYIKIKVNIRMVANPKCGYLIICFLKSFSRYMLIQKNYILYKKLYTLNKYTIYSKIEVIYVRRYYFEKRNSLKGNF